MGRCHDLTNQCAPPLQIMKYTNEHAVTAGISFSDRWSECGVGLSFQCIIGSIIYRLAPLVTGPFLHILMIGQMLEP